MPKLHVVFPAREEKLPLQIRHLDQLRAFRLFHARVFERHEERRHKRPLRVSQVVEQIERLLRIVVGFTRQSNDERAEWEPVVTL